MWLYCLLSDLCSITALPTWASTMSTVSHHFYCLLHSLLQWHNDCTFSTRLGLISRGPSSEVLLQSECSDQFPDALSVPQGWSHVKPPWQRDPCTVFSLWSGCLVTNQALSIHVCWSQKLSWLPAATVWMLLLVFWHVMAWDLLKQCMLTILLWSVKEWCICRQAYTSAQCSLAITADSQGCQSCTIVPDLQISTVFVRSFSNDLCLFAEFESFVSASHT